MSAKEMSDRAEKIARLKELEKKATPGPWIAFPYGDEPCVVLGTAFHERSGRIWSDADEWVPDNGDDAYLVAELRNEALAIIEEQEREIERLKKVCESALNDAHLEGAEETEAILRLALGD